MSAACAETVTDVSCEHARLILEPYFSAMREVYLDRGFERVKSVRFYCAPGMHDTNRHFAACRDDGKVMTAAPELVEKDERIVVAIFAHEFGHATDFLYPGEFALGHGRQAIRRSADEIGPKHWARWIRSWEGRDTDTVELTADAIAEYVTGNRIGYVGPCMLQRFGTGVPRPVGLR